MKAQFKFLAGGRAGQTETVAKAYIGIGRHPLSDIRFDAERDLDVSARHAAVIRRGDDFVVQDLQSKNGTMVNGKRITGDVILTDGDVLGFGVDGPALEFHVVDRDASDAPSTSAEQSAGRSSQARAPMPAQAAGRGRSSTAVRVALEVAKQTRELRNTTKVLFGLLFLVAGGFGFLQWKNAHEREQNYLTFQHTVDSLQAEAQRNAALFATQMQGLKDAYNQAQGESQRLQSELAAARQSGDPATLTRLRNELNAAVARQHGLTIAAGVDYRAIAHTNQDAVAIVIVEYPDNTKFSGTAFAIDTLGTMITNKHVLAGEDGTRRPQRIAVKFSGSKQWFRGQFVGVADSVDLGMLKIDIHGGTPRILGIEPDARSLETGDPLAILGYPLGLDLPMEGQGMDAVAEPTLTAGVASKVLSNLVQVDGYGAPGSSGSPIFNRDGKVVAVLYGGQAESNGKIIFSVPASILLDFIAKQGVHLP